MEQDKQIVSQQQQINGVPALQNQIDTAKKALQGKPLHQASKIDISETLDKIYFLIGLRNQFIPTKDEETAIMGWMVQNYPLKTLDELILAFNLAIQGEFDIEDKDIKVYDQFTCEYLARIMNGYRKWLKDKSQKVEPVKKIVFGNHITSQEDKLKDIEDWKSREDIKIEFIPPYLYDYLIEFELLKLTAKEKWEMIEQATDLRKTILQSEAEKALERKQKDPVDAYNKFLNELNAGEIKGDEVGRIKELSKKIAVYQYLILNKL